MDLLLHKKILIVDDAPMVVMSMRTIMINASYDVVTASSGREGLEKLAVEIPDLITVDALMKEMNGYELTRRIRSIESMKDIPIIMLTGMKMQSDVNDAMLAGANDFISKPANPEKLLQIVNTLINKSKR